MSDINKSTPSLSRKEAKKISQEIDLQLKKEKAELSKITGPKILLLGSGDSGKTTVLKQLKILHGNGFSDTDRENFRQVIQQNILGTTFTIIDALESGGPLNLSAAALPCIATLKELRNKPECFENSPKNPIVSAIVTLQTEPNFIKCLERANELQIQDTAEFFLSRAARYWDPKYTPTDNEILRARLRTTSVTETRFFIDNATFRVFDVGGQRSDRLFWVPYFSDNINAILFIASLAAYDQQLVEDRSVNRMMDALVLFESICNNPLLKSVSFILFLNKMDLCEKKLKSSNAKRYFPDFDGPNDLKNVGKYFKQKFLAQCKDPAKKIYTHFTTGTDTAHMRVIISAVREIVIKLSLQTSGVF